MPEKKTPVAIWPQKESSWNRVWPSGKRPLPNESFRWINCGLVWSPFRRNWRKAVAQAVAEVTSRLEMQSKNREELLTKAFEGERKVLAARIQSLEKTVKEQAEQIDRS